MSQMAPAKVYVRWMIRRDIPEVLAIAAEVEPAWTEGDFLKAMRQRNQIGMVAERGQDVLGFMVYALHKRHIEVLNFAVAPAWRRRRVGRTMLEKLVGKLSSHRRGRITIVVPEDNLALQLFLKAHAFRARAVHRGRFRELGQDGYELSYLVDPDEIDPHDPHEGWPRNRIERFGVPECEG